VGIGHCRELHDRGTAKGFPDVDVEPADGVLGVFMSLNLFLFFCLLGSDVDPDLFPDWRVGERRVYATLKFLLYTILAAS
jgi:NADH:ubiquinone oxidoreductase subunit 4 (subunit M)